MTRRVVTAPVLPLTWLRDFPCLRFLASLNQRKLVEQLVRKGMVRQSHAESTIILIVRSSPMVPTEFRATDTSHGCRL